MNRKRMFERIRNRFRRTKRTHWRSLASPLLFHSKSQASRCIEENVENQPNRRLIAGNPFRNSIELRSYFTSALYRHTDPWAYVGCSIFSELARSWRLNNMRAFIFFLFLNVLYIGHTWYVRSLVGFGLQQAPQKRGEQKSVIVKKVSNIPSPKKTKPFFFFLRFCF